VISNYGDMFVNHVKSLVIIISQMGFFKGDDDKYVVHLNFDKQSSNGRWQEM
jgi:hypothetical protein